MYGNFFGFGYWLLAFSFWLLAIDHWLLVFSKNLLDVINVGGANCCQTNEMINGYLC